MSGNNVPQLPAAFQRLAWSNLVAQSADQIALGMANHDRSSGAPYMGTVSARACGRNGRMNTRPKYTVYRNGKPVTDDAPLEDGDILRVDSFAGTFDAHVAPPVWDQREMATAHAGECEYGMGRELFRLFRTNAASAELGGGICLP